MINLRAKDWKKGIDGKIIPLVLTVYKSKTKRYLAYE